MGPAAGLAFVFRLHRAVGIERDKAHVVNRLARAREKHIEDRQRAPEPAAAQLVLHLFRDEEAEAQHRVERVLQPADLAGKPAARQSLDVGNATDGLQAAQHVGGGVGKEGVGIEKVRPAEHVVDHGLWLRDVLVRPGADLAELALLEPGPGGVEALGVPLPAPFMRIGHERRCRGGLHSGQQARRIIGAGALRRGRARHRCYQGAGSERSRQSRSPTCIHRFSSLKRRASAPVQLRRCPARPASRRCWRAIPSSAPRRGSTS